VSNSLLAVVRSEWTKLRTLRSTWLTLLLALVISVGIGLVSGGSARSAFESGNADLVRPDFNPIDAGFIGLVYGQLSLVAFGILLVGGEHSSGSIRASLAAVPQRGLFYVGKLAVGIAVALPASLAMAFSSWPATQLGLGPYGASIQEPGVLRAVFGAALYTTLIGVFAAGVAAILRSSVLSMAVLIPFFFIIGPILANLPGVREVARYLPDQAGQQIMTVGPPGGGALGPGWGLMVLVAWTVAALAGGYLLLRHRDA
jgi:ABC-type transport system involved in multi-copper enzyme maturation permease subunit